MKLSSIRLRFTLRTLFILVTALCLWLGWNASTVHHRRQLRAQMIARGWAFFDLGNAKTASSTMPLITQILPRSNEPLSWIRQMLGDSLVPWIGYPTGLPRAERKQDEDQLESAFPETRFVETSPQTDPMMSSPLD